MILQSDISDSVRLVSDRRHALAQMTDIPDMWRYADEWNKLGADFEALGYTINAEKCYEKSKYYHAQAGPRQLPLVPYRVLYCASCDAWTDHALNVTGDYYVCGCGAGNKIEDGGIASAIMVLESE